LLATVSAGAPGIAAAARGVSQALSGLAEIGVPHDGAEIRAVLDRLSSGAPAPAG
jgi:hypothetical protein